MLFYLFLPPCCNEASGVGVVACQGYTAGDRTETHTHPPSSLYLSCGACAPLVGTAAFLRGGPPMDSSGTDAPQHCPQQHPQIPATQENHLFWRPGGRTVPERSDHEINGIRRLRPSPGFCPLDWGGQSPRSKVTNATSSPSLSPFLSWPRICPLSLIF